MKVSQAQSPLRIATWASLILSQAPAKPALKGAPGHSEDPLILVIFNARPPATTSLSSAVQSDSSFFPVDICISSWSGFSIGGAHNHNASFENPNRIKQRPEFTNKPTQAQQTQSPGQGSQDGLPLKTRQGRARGVLLRTGATAPSSTAPSAPSPPKSRSYTERDVR